MDWFDYYIPIFKNLFLLYSYLNFFVKNPLNIDLFITYKKKYLYLTLFKRGVGTIFTLRPSIFLKILKVKKALKKSLRLKSLQFIFLKKLLLLIRPSDLNILVIGKFKNLIQFLNILFSNSKFSFISPITQKKAYIRDLSYLMRFLRISFIFTKNFSYKKFKKLSRLKRKITRKLIKFNNLEF